MGWEAAAGPKAGASDLQGTGVASPLGPETSVAFILSSDLTVLLEPSLKLGHSWASCSLCFTVFLAPTHHDGSPEYVYVCVYMYGEGCWVWGEGRFR